MTPRVHTFAPTTGPDTMWGRWLDTARVEVIGDTSATRRVVLLTPLRWRDASGYTVHVPEAFTSDGASLPRVVWWLMGGRLALDYIRSALVHDYACYRRFGTSADATARFYRGLRADAMAFWRADACRIAVRNWGPQWEERR